MIDYRKLTIEEKVGQTLMVGFEGTYLTDELKDLIRDYKIGNILLFTRNIKSTEDLFKLCQDLQKEALTHIGIPMFIGIDQEGGMVTRIFDKATVFPGAMSIAATNDVNNAYLTGLYMAAELEALGINMNFSPVLDVNNNPLNPVIGVRSYSDDVHTVSKFSEAYISGLQSRIFATAKHFPGHGDTHVDSHLDLPRVPYDLKRLHEIELAPFKNAIKQNIKAIMSAHIIYDAIDPHRPATLSPILLTQLLRKELKFEGLIVTDGMEMKAILNKYGAVESSVPAIKAGANILLYCHYLDQQIAAAKLIKNSVHEGLLDVNILNERVERILHYKQDLNLNILNQTYDVVRPIVENDRHRMFAQSVLDQSLTLVKGERFVQKGKTLFIGTLPKATTIADDLDGENSVINLLQKDIKEFSYVLSDIEPSDKDIKKVCEMAKNFDQVIFTTYNANIYTSQQTLMKELHKLNKDIHIISLRNPYDLMLVKEIKNYTCLYEYTDNSIRTLKAYLKGELEPKGRFPIHG